MNDDIKIHENIRNSILKIYKDFNKNINTLYEDINNSLYQLKSENSLSFKEEYLHSLQLKITYYKINIKNVEHLLYQWIEKKNIPDKKHTEQIIINLNEKCKKYIENNKASIINSTETDDYEKAKFKLEKDFKVLNIYLKVLHEFLYKIVDDNLIIYIEGNPKQQLNLIKKELRKCITSLVKSIDKIDMQTQKNNSKQVAQENTKHIKEEKKDDIIEKDNITTTLTPLEEKFLNYTNSLDDDVFVKKMNKEYRKLCLEEGIKYANGYGFGKSVIKYYIVALILIDICENNEKQIINKGIALVINGTFNPSNFKDFMQYIISVLLNINENAFSQGISIIEENHQNLLNHPLCEKKVSIQSCDNLSNYIYKIKNEVSNSKFEEKPKPKSKDPQNIEQEKVNYTRTSNEENTKTSSFDFIKSKKFIIGIIVVILCIVGIPTFTSFKQKADLQKATEKLYETTGADKTYVKYNYTPTDNSVTDTHIKTKYFIFTEFDKDSGIRDYFYYLVNKKDFTVYYYDTAQSIMVPYSDYMNSNTLVGKFINDYLTCYHGEQYEGEPLDFPETISDYISQNGSEAFYKKLKEIMADADSTTVDNYGAVYYVSLILGGYSASELENSDYSDYY